MTGSPVVVLDGDRFYVADPSGDADGGSDGFYADDVRFLRRWRLRIDGQRPEVLGGGEDGDPAAWSVHGRVPGLTTHRRLRVSRAGLRDTLHLTNHARAPRDAVVSFAFDADFADLLEVRRRTSGRGLQFAPDMPPVAFTRSWDAGTGAWRFTGATAGWWAGVAVTFTVDGVPGDTDFSWRCEIPPRTTATVEARVVLLHDAQQSVDPGTTLAAAEQAARDRHDEWRRRVPALSTRSAPLARTWARSLADLDALRIPRRRPGGGDDDQELLVPAAGCPWFMAVFGRDTLLTCLFTLALGQEPAKAALRALADLQATADDPERDAGPGKIVHEVRAGKLAAASGALPYYGSVDATPLFVVLAAETWRWTGDDALLRELEPNLRAAMGWIEGPADLTGRGYVEFQRRSSHGLDVQSWKDSPDSMLFADGTQAATPLAVSEVQGYAYAARLGLAAVARKVWGDGSYADRLERDADALRERFDRDFWVPSPAGGHYALGLDGDGRRVDALTSAIGHVLAAGIAADGRIGPTARALLAPDLFSGWGVRTMSTGAVGYDPIGYHTGTVWPHDTAMAAIGLAAIGHRAEALALLDALLDAAAHVGWRLPEVLTGHPRADTRLPIVYPTSSSPQAWAAAAPVGALVAILGLTPDPDSRSIIAPHPVPRDLDLALSGVPAFGRGWDVVAAHGRVRVTPAAPT